MTSEETTAPMPTCGPEHTVTTRVYNKRTLGAHLYFIDAILVDSVRGPIAVELCLPGALVSNQQLVKTTVGADVLTTPPRGAEVDAEEEQAGPSLAGGQHQAASSTPADIKVGDVLVARVREELNAKPRFPRQKILHVDAFCVAEAWAETFSEVGKKIKFAGHSTYAFNPPLFFGLGKRRNRRKKKAGAAGDHEGMLDEGGNHAEPEAGGPPGDLLVTGSSSGEVEVVEDEEDVEGRKNVDHGVVHTTSDTTSEELQLPRTDPALILQCHAPLADRVAAFFQGAVASNCTKDRLVYVYDDVVDVDAVDAHDHSLQSASENLFKKQLLDLRRAIIRKEDVDVVAERAHTLLQDLPVYFQSILHRIYFVTEPQPCVSLAECLGKHFSEGKNGESSQEDSLRKFLCFPRELESRVFEYSVKERSSAGLCTPGSGGMRLCHSVVYADGLFWVGLRTPHLVVPERARNSVPSGAYWKLLEISERYALRNEVLAPPTKDEDQSPASTEPSSSPASTPNDKTDLLVSSMESMKIAPMEDHSPLNEHVVPRHLKGLWATRYYGRRAAIDVGASPGGWSYCLCTQYAIGKTFAVDPAEHMHDLVKKCFSEKTEPMSTFSWMKPPAKLPLVSGQESERNHDREDLHRPRGRSGRDVGGGSIIEHWQLRGEQFLERCLDAAALAAEEIPLRFGIFVCDMNCELESSVDLLRKFVEAELLERPALCVVTFKNTCRSKAEFAERKQKGLGLLAAAFSEGGVGLTGVKELHLFANTKMETTVVGELLG